MVLCHQTSKPRVRAGCRERVDKQFFCDSCCQKSIFDAIFVMSTNQLRFNDVKALFQVKLRNAFVFE